MKTSRNIWNCFVRAYCDERNGGAKEEIEISVTEEEEDLFSFYE